MTAIEDNLFARAAAAFDLNPSTSDLDFPTPGALAAELTAGTELHARHLDLIDQAFVDIAAGQVNRVVITLPPRHGKSRRVAIWGALWFLLNFPRRKVVVATNSSSLALEHSQFARSLVAEHGERLGIPLSRTSASKSNWKLAGYGGGMLAIGLEVLFTGFGADLLIIDDPFKDQRDAASPTQRKAVWEWWTHVAQPRLEPAGAVIVIQTRWHPDDLVGRILAQRNPDWRVINLPAIAEDDDQLGRKPGEALWPARWPLERLEQLKSEEGVGERAWQALYQQHPSPPGGTIWNIEWIDAHRVPTGELPQFLRVMVSVDPSGSSKDDAAEQGVIVLALGADGHVYVLGDYSLRSTPVERHRQVCIAAVEHGATEILIEEDYGGDANEHQIAVAWRDFIRNDLRARAIRQVPQIRTVRAAGQGPKALRAEHASGWYQAGKVHHVTDGTDRLAQLEEQMIDWTGDGPSPDRVDALSHGVRELLTAPMRVASPATDRWSRARGAR